MKLRKVAWLLLVGVYFVISCVDKPNNGHEATDDHEPDWSEEVGFDEKVSTYEDNNRDIWQKPERVIDLLGPLRDKTVVDLGAGTGYFAFRLVSKAKKVIAVDIDEDFIKFLNEKRLLLPANQQDKFEARLAKKDDPMIRPGEADAVLIVNTYAYLEDRIQYFQKFRKVLSPGAKLVIIEFKMKNIPNGPPVEEKVAISTVEQELRASGFSDIDVDDQTLDYQYIVTAKA